jgi:hypothetical protein
MDQSDSPGWTTWKRALFAIDGGVGCAGVLARTRWTGSPVAGADVGEAGSEPWSERLIACARFGTAGEADPEPVDGARSGSGVPVNRRVRSDSASFTSTSDWSAALGALGAAGDSGTAGVWGPPGVASIGTGSDLGGAVVTGAACLGATGASLSGARVSDPGSVANRRASGSSTGSLSTGAPSPVSSLPPPVPGELGVGATSNGSGVSSPGSKSGASRSLPGCCGAPPVG